MNAREVLQALLDGKTVMERFPGWRGEYIRLNGDDIEHTVAGKWENSNAIPSITTKYASVKEDDEYPLTFEDATQKLEEGKKIESEEPKIRFKLEEGEFIIYIDWDKRDTIVDDRDISQKLMSGMWRVVE